MLTPLFAETLRHARDRGALISTLFPTASRIYRKFGYEVIADFVTVELPTTALAAVPRPDAIQTRRADLSDFDRIREIYDAWAIAQNGPLSRRGASFTATAEEFLAELHRRDGGRGRHRSDLRIRVLEPGPGVRRARCTQCDRSAGQ